MQKKNVFDEQKGTDEVKVSTANDDEDFGILKIWTAGLNC